MARGKRKTSQPKKEPTAPIARAVPAVEIAKPRITEYGIQLLVFVAFCLCSYLLVWLVTGYTLGLNFFFGVLIVGFFVVCVFSYLHDRYYRDEDEIETGP